MVNAGQPRGAGPGAGSVGVRRRRSAPRSGSDRLTNQESRETELRLKNPVSCATIHDHLPRLTAFDWQWRAIGNKPLHTPTAVYNRRSETDHVTPSNILTIQAQLAQAYLPTLTYHPQ